MWKEWIGRKWFIMINELEFGLVAAINDNPLNIGYWEIYADWLQENNKDNQAKSILNIIKRCKKYNPNWLELLDCKVLLNRIFDSVTQNGEGIVFKNKEIEVSFDHNQD